MKKLCFCLLATISLSAYASLGESSEEVNNDAKNLSSWVSNIETTDNYVIKSINTENTQIKEYINPASDTVFAIRWAGKRIPNMKVLLGNYFDEFMNTKGSSHGLTSGSSANTDLISNYGGVPGHFFGQVILTKYLPQGLKIGDLK
ncbi:MAG: DUF2844 domain-containing protein [Neisseriales bacterium]|nr:MAG: DUF2844 domain-containing protein [Neisseriales bacterium]HRG62518.1 DUF2844 domain-containing protein [Burkholderiales bacterium]